MDDNNLTPEQLLDNYERDSRAALEWTHDTFRELSFREKLVHYGSIVFVAIAMLFEGVKYVFDLNQSLLEYFSYIYFAASGISLALKLYYVLQRYAHRMAVIAASEERFRSIIDSLERSKLSMNNARRISGDYIKRIAEKLHLTSTIIYVTEEKMFPREYESIFAEDPDGETTDSEIEVLNII